MTETDLHRFAGSPSQKLFAIGCMLLFLALAALTIDYFTGGTVVADARIGTRGPELLFQGESGLWVPTNWLGYWWHTAKPLFAIPVFGGFAAVAVWHQWETNLANREHGCDD